MNIRKGIPYNNIQTLDIYTKTDSTPNVPVIIYVHGGAWMSGGSGCSTEVCEIMIKYGYLLVAPTYSLSSNVYHGMTYQLIFTCLLPMLHACAIFDIPNIIIALIVCVLCVSGVMLIYESNKTITKTHPCHVNDVLDAIHWVHTNIKAYGGDPSNVFLLGHSSGGHLVTLASHMTTVPIRGVIGLSGVYSPSRLTDPFLRNVYSKIFHNDERAFPIEHVSHTTSPHLLINAATDMGLEKHTSDYISKLNTFNIEASSLIISGTNHFSIRRYWDSWNQVVPRSIHAFCQRHYTLM
jgi:acetyl esterase/lipase